MTSNQNHFLFSFQDPEDFRRLKGVFEAAGYTDAKILSTLGVKDLSAIQGDNMPLLLHRTGRGTPLDTFIRLFLIKVPCDIEAVRRAVRPMKIKTWTKVGLVQIKKTSVAAAVELLPYKNLLLAFDLPAILNTPLKQNYVMGVGSSTLTLANLTVRRHSHRTLDLGTGSGIHGLLASPHSERVVAVDLNPRAVAFATFNTKLNDISNMDCVQGDLFQQVKNQTFDLVVTNPPFVISPETRYIYRDGGMQADQITRKIVQQVPDFLNEGGFCQILCNWVVKAGRDWHERLQHWFENTGCDVWVMRSETHDAAAYATKWICHTEFNDQEMGFSERFQQWMAYYKKQRIESVISGIITMRKSSVHPNWFRADDAPERMQGTCGNYIIRGFELRDFLETMHDNRELINTCLRVSPDVRLERQSTPSVDGWLEDVTRIHLTKGFVYSGNIDPFVANLIVGCNGNQKLKDLLDKMAVALGAKASDITPAFCSIVRGLIEKGYLLPEHFYPRKQGNCVTGSAIN